MMPITKSRHLGNYHNQKYVQKSTKLKQIFVKKTWYLRRILQTEEYNFVWMAKIEFAILGLVMYLCAIFLRGFLCLTFPV